MMMKLTDLTPAMLDVIDNWTNEQGAECAISELERISDVLLDEGGMVSDRDRIEALRAVRNLKQELTAFVREGGE